jgi:hypothetical protein
MPWYINPAITCKVLNRIANRYPCANLHELKTTLDHATQLLWSKQENFCTGKSSVAIEESGLNGAGHKGPVSQTIQQEIQ